MSKSRPSKEFRAFDAMMGQLLTVPKAVLNERMAEHQAKVAATPAHKKRGPRPRVRPDASPDAS